MVSDADIDRLMKLAKENRLPKDFSDWGLSDANGWTVAHQLVAAQHCPPEDQVKKGNFPWLARDNKRTTVLAAAICYELPANYKLWDALVDGKKSLAHEYVKNHEIPDHFSREILELRDDKDWSVALTAAIHEKLPRSKDYEDAWIEVSKNVGIRQFTSIEDTSRRLGDMRNKRREPERLQQQFPPGGPIGFKM